MWMSAVWAAAAAISAQTARARSMPALVQAAMRLQVQHLAGVSYSSCYGHASTKEQDGT